MAHRRAPHGTPQWWRGARIARFVAHVGVPCRGGVPTPVDEGHRRPARTVRLPIVQPGPLVFGLDEAAQSGLSAAAVRHGLRTGRFVRLRRGLFCDATLWQRTGASPMARRVLETRAAWLAIGRRGWASHYTAALLHGLPVPYGQPAAVTISRTNRADGRHCLPGLVLRTATVDPVDIVTDWGMPIASAARTSLDLARVHGFAPALVVADAALARGAAMSAELDRIATSMHDSSPAMPPDAGSRRTSRGRSPCSSTGNYRSPRATSGSSEKVVEE